MRKTFKVVVTVSSTWRGDDKDVVKTDIIAAARSIGFAVKPKAVKVVQVHKK